MLLPFAAQAQHIIIRDAKGHIVNNDTLEYVAEFTQKPPYTKIDCYFYAQNTGPSTMIMGARKSEIILHPNVVDHAICFAKQCFLSSVYVSPLHDTVASGAIDSTFSGHYRYDKLTLPPSRDLVAYTLYDVNNPADSAIVYVIYNTMPTSTGLYQTTGPFAALHAYPNPAGNTVNIVWNGALSSGNPELIITNALGQLINRQNININANTFAMDISGWAAGTYYYSLIIKGERISNGSFVKRQ